VSRDAYGMPKGEWNLPPGCTSQMIDDAAGDGSSCDGDCEEDGTQQHVACDGCDGDPDCCRADNKRDWLCCACWAERHPGTVWGDEDEPLDDGEAVDPQPTQGEQVTERDACTQAFEDRDLRAADKR
jgi:hypothetical protein